MSRTTW